MDNYYEEIGTLFTQAENIRNKYCLTRSNDMQPETMLPYFKILNKAGIKLRKNDALIKMNFTSGDPGQDRYVHLDYIKRDNTYSTDTFCFKRGQEIVSCYDDNSLRNSTTYFDEHPLNINDEIDRNTLKYRQLVKLLGTVHKLQATTHVTNIDGKVVFIEKPKDYNRAKKLWD